MIWLARASAVASVWVLAALLLAVLVDLSSNETYQGLVGVVLVVLAVPASVRVFRFGVDATADTVTVRGFGRARRIPIRSIAEVGAGAVPAIRWTDDAGDKRVTKLSAFRQDTRVAAANRRGRQAVAELGDWVRRHH
ncbi:MAG TPA: hypothetical protein VHW44_12960 [Pseudonocardiaceae bacterium]|jgi:hypothetical protein|nr:hypothetical protein [Pseudonocardiaceae bacterium]